MALKYPDEQILFNFYEDRLDILQGLQKLFKKMPFLVPDNLRFCAYEYKGDSVENLMSIKDTGKADKSYRTMVSILAFQQDMLNTEQAIFFSDETYLSRTRGVTRVCPQSWIVKGSHLSNFSLFMSTSRGSPRGVGSKI